MLDICWDLKSVEGKEALKYGNKGLKLAIQTKNYTLQSIALKNIGVINLFTGDYDKAEEYHLKALKIFNSINNSEGISGCHNNLGMIYAIKGDFISAVKHYEKSLVIDKKTNNINGIANSLTNLGNVFQKQGNYNQAIEYYIEVLKIREKLNDKTGIADVYNNIGALNEKQHEYDKALQNYQKALILYIESQNRRKSSNVLHNIGFVLSTQEHYTQAIEYYFQALEIRKEYGAKKGIASTTLNIGELYQKLNKYNEAYRYYSESLKLYNEIDSKPGISDAYTSIGSYYKDIHKYNKAIEYFEKAIRIAKELELRLNIQRIYKELSLVYASWSKYTKAYEYRLLYEQMKDSLSNEKNSKRIIELQLQFEFEKHQKELELEGQLEKLRKIKELNKQKIINYSLIGGLTTIIIIAFFVYRAYKIKQKDNLLLIEQKNQIHEKNEELHLYQEELISQKEDLQVQKDIVTNHRDKIALQNQKITDSIQYALRIQEALLPPEKFFTEIFSDHFLFNQPKDIVSGDFYWLKSFNDKIFIAVADSTGHGVPGAFMSLLGISSLNEIVNNSNNDNAAAILNKLRNHLKNSLNQKGNKTESRDGIDIALCIIDKSTNKIQFAGAYNPLIIIKDAKNENHDNLIELKGDKMPIGLHFKEKDSFTNQIIKIDSSDKFYLFTDGYLDQFGGLHGRKFLLNRFKKLLLEIHNLPMAEQKIGLLKAYEDWKEDKEQIDDILILGFTI
ncbi:MAG: tetratricopeptide repeat protein [Bacteroidota bacterium]